ncbi:MAG: S1 RNA-binding domain-containing protein, partial [Deinococcales bacterium]
MRALLQHRLSPTLKERLKTDFPKLAEQSSERERRAESAERDLTRYYHARWAKDHVGEAFHGIVSGVTNFGVFVSLPNGVEGLVHVSHLDDDYYIYLEDSLMLMGKHTRKRYRMGDRVEVKVLLANPTQRQIDLIPASMEMPEVEVEEKPVQKKPPKTLKAPSAFGAEEVAQEPAGGNGRAAKGGAKGASRGRGKGAAKAGAKGAAEGGAKPAAKGSAKAGAKGAAEKGAAPKGATEEGAAAAKAPKRGGKSAAKAPAKGTKAEA